MSWIKSRKIEIDGDSVTVKFKYDKKGNTWHGDYPDFEETPRHTKDDRPWVNVISDACIHMEGEYEDCGSCRFLKKERPSDLIGMCMNDNMKKQTKEALE